VIDLAFSQELEALNAEVVMTLKEKTTDTEPIWEKRVSIVDGVATFEIEASDTDNLSYKTYKWDIRIITESGGTTCVETPFGPADFVVAEVVGSGRAHND